MTSTKDPSKKNAEALIDADVYEAARRRAEANAQELAKVARSIIYAASLEAQPSDDAVAHPAIRPANVDRRRLRFCVDRHQYDIAKGRIRASGQSMTAALEAGLEAYAFSGVLPTNRKRS